MKQSHGEVRIINGKRVASPEYRLWQNIKNRCLNPKATDYRYYGGRGITVCEEWAGDFSRFLQDVGRRPEPGLTLDRIDPDAGYAPGNVRWVGRLEQSRNRPYASVRAWEIAEELGVTAKHIYHMMWQVRQKDRGDTKWFSLSPDKEALIRGYMRDKNATCDN